MTYCEFCGEEIGYLPFKCKYCGGTYCKSHRLPENHECSFELKHTPLVPTSSKEDTPLRAEAYRRSTSYKQKPYKYKKKHSYEGMPNNFLTPQEANGTTFIILSLLICTILGLFIPQFINLSIYGLSQYYFWILFTSLFSNSSSIGLVSGDYFGLIFLFILIFFLFNISKSLELRFGTKFIVGLYILCAAATGLTYVLIRLLLLPLYPIDMANGAYIGLASGGILGMIAFMIFPFPDREMMLLCYFVPVKMKGKVLIAILILFNLIPGIIYGILLSPLYFAIYLPELGGIRASYPLFRYKFRNRFQMSF